MNLLSEILKLRSIFSLFCNAGKTILNIVDLSDLAQVTCPQTEFELLKKHKLNKTFQDFLH